MYRIAREAKSRVSIVRSVSGVTANEEERSLQHWYHRSFGCRLLALISNHHTAV
jgi:hypothetical protein